mgnify:CR=1 FL=1
MLKGLHLFSGGLDSILSYKILQESNFRADAVFFETPFFSSEKPIEYGKKNNINVRIINIFPEYISVLKSPKYGYGKNLNPCIDCKALMINKACEIAKREGYDFVSTGEVLGQRPMSQTKGGLVKQEKLLLNKDMVFRVLSYDSNPHNERMKAIKRVNITGRERTIQIKMAEERNINEYQTPSGGCLLTYKEYSYKAKTLLMKNLIEERYFYMIKSGRFLEFEKGAAVIGRDEKDNEKLLSLRKNEKGFQIQTGKGPVALIIGDISEEEIFSFKESLLNYSKNSKNEKDYICSI